MEKGPPIRNSKKLWKILGACGVVLKNERRTSNIERPTSNKKTNIQYRTFNDYFYFFSAVLILVTKILINSSASCKISFSSSGFKLCFFMFPHSITPWRDWTFDVRCSFFSVRPGQKQDCRSPRQRCWWSSVRTEVFFPYIFPTRVNVETWPSAFQHRQWEAATGNGG